MPESLLSISGLFVAMALGCFLSGSIPFGFLIGLSQGIDVRKHGSGNIGATNVFRVMGKKWGSLAFFLDFSKGFFPVLVVRSISSGWDASWVGWLGIVAAMMCILGHNYTPWLGFKGGKGIATSAGVLMALVPWTLVVALATWIIVVKISRTVSIASIAASISLPIATILFYPHHTVLLGFSVLAGMLGIWRHRSNIVRLYQGTEPKIGQKKS